MQAPHPFHIHNWFHGWLLRAQNGWHRAGGGAGGEGGTGSGRGGGVGQSVQPPQPDQRHLALHVCVLRGQKALQICVDGHWVQAPQPVHSHRASHGCVWYSQWPRQSTGGGGAGGGEDTSAVTACMIANTSMTGSWAWVGPVARRLNGSNCGTYNDAALAIFSQMPRRRSVGNLKSGPAPHVWAFYRCIMVCTLSLFSLSCVGNLA